MGGSLLAIVYYELVQYNNVPIRLRNDSHPACRASAIGLLSLMFTGIVKNSMNVVILSHFNGIHRFHGATEGNLNYYESETLLFINAYMLPFNL